MVRVARRALRAGLRDVRRCKNATTNLGDGRTMGIMLAQIPLRPLRPNKPSPHIGAKLLMVYVGCVCGGVVRAVMVYVAVSVGL